MESKVYEVRPIGTNLDKKAIAWLGAIGGVLAVVLIGGNILFQLGTAYASMERITLVYKGGPFDSNQFVKVVSPGQGRFFTGGLLEETYSYPATNRSYIVSSRANEGDVQGVDELSVKAKDGNTLKVEAAVYFKLDQNPDVLREFHEKHGLKYAAWTEDGWNRLLSDMIRQPLQDAFQEETVKYGPIEAISEVGKLKIRDAVAKTLQTRIDKAMAGHYMKITSFALKDINPAKDIQAALENVVKSQQEILAAENQRQAGLKIAQKNKAIRESLKGAGGMEAVLADAVDKGQVKFWVVPQGQNFTVSPGK